MNMKIAAVIYKFFPYGGVQLDFLRIVEELLSRGHSVEVFATQWEGELPPHVGLHLVEVGGNSNHAKMFDFGRRAAALTANGDFDLVFGVNRVPGLDVYFAGDNCFKARSVRERSWLYRLMPRCRTYCKLEESVFARGGKCRIMLIVPGQQPDFELFYHTEPSRFVLLPPGIPPDRCRPDNAAGIRAAKRAELGADENTIILLQIGSGFATKGVDRAIRAVAALPTAWKSQVRFLVVGRDNPRKYERLATRLGVAGRVQFLGGRNDVPALLLAADLMLHPAVNDAAAAVLAEAIVAGLPAICTANCGFAALIAQARSGVIVPEPFKQEELNRRLEKMLETPAQLQAYQDNAILYSENADFFGRSAAAVDYMERLAAEKQAK
ncbi:MAG: glycosyltransferase family 4 protein [Victivallaceae bacterium]|nr:glycosyltransferase family 4 protein [Victivallaceae bacterium]